MSTKKQLMIDGAIQTVSLEEVIVKFDKLICDYAWKIHSSRFARHSDFEDIKQDLLITTMNAYDKYDLAKSNSHFSTYLVHALKNHHKSLYKYYSDAQRDRGLARTGAFSDYTAEGNDDVTGYANMEDTITSESSIFGYDANNTITIEDVDTEELLDSLYECLDDIDKRTLKAIVTYGNDSPTLLAEKLGLNSRQSYYRRRERLNTKLQPLLEIVGYSNI